ncbi:hypothetical protein [Candidatus Villigracilis affinis]|uniref:hypothetical protein n=1 Tax=Candidatus Villigracilis affinis TaxID=3140682 RepID=UPI001DCE7F05|nr:hypothetical protein [Anaerolineales bacterium]
MIENTPVTYCYVHPTRETTLRCKRCEKPICASCAQRTPTGYLCKDCVNQHKKIFDTALWYDYLLGITATSILSVITSGLLAFVATFIGFYMIFVSFAVAGGAGVFLSNIALRVTGKRRSAGCLSARRLCWARYPSLYFVFTNNMFSIIAIGIYAVVATSTVYARLAGIQL